MHIGILETDILEPAIKEQYGSYAEMFQRLFKSIDPHISFSAYSITEQHYPKSDDECDAYLITGSKFSIYENKPWIKKLKNYIVSLHQQKKKLIGVCFGHQLIAEALGGRVEKYKKGWCVGNIESYIEKEKPWMPPLLTSYTLLTTHQDQVVELPDEAELIASSECCPISSFQINNDILTFQGHPEYSEDYLVYLMNKRRGVIGETKINHALDSLKIPQDTQKVARCIIEFIIK